MFESWQRETGELGGLGRRVYPPGKAGCVEQEKHVSPSQPVPSGKTSAIDSLDTKEILNVFICTDYILFVFSFVCAWVIQARYL